MAGNRFSSPAASNVRGKINMRFHEGNFAYDIEQQRDPFTQLLSAWRFTVYRLRPFEAVITRGESKTREEAEEQARKIVSNLTRNSEKAA